MGDQKRKIMPVRSITEFIMSDFRKEGWSGWCHLETGKGSTVTLLVKVLGARDLHQPFADAERHVFAAAGFTD